jgi:hypothetical protein
VVSLDYETKLSYCRSGHSACFVPTHSKTFGKGSSVCVVNWSWRQLNLCYFPGWSERFSIHRIQTVLGSHPASDPLGTGGSFHCIKAAGTWGLPLTSAHCQSLEYVELYLHSLIRLHAMGLNYTQEITFTFRRQNVGQNRNMKIADRSFENVSQFKYLGTTVTN